MESDKLPKWWDSNFAHSSLVFVRSFVHSACCWAQFGQHSILATATAAKAEEKLRKRRPERVTSGQQRGFAKRASCALVVLDGAQMSTRAPTICQCKIGARLTILVKLRRELAKVSKLHKHDWRPVTFFGSKRTTSTGGSPVPTWSQARAMHNSLNCLRSELLFLGGAPPSGRRLLATHGGAHLVSGAPLHCFTPSASASASSNSACLLASSPLMPPPSQHFVL